MRYGRVLTSDEAHWSIVGNKIHEVNPSVKRLGFFDPDKKRIEVRAGEVPSMEDANRQRNETEFYSFFSRNEFEKQVFEDYQKMLNDGKSVEHIVKTVNDMLGYDMFYQDKKGKLQQLFDILTICYFLVLLSNSAISYVHLVK